MLRLLSVIAILLLFLRHSDQSAPKGRRLGVPVSAPTPSVFATPTLNSPSIMTPTISTPTNSQPSIVNTPTIPNNQPVGQPTAHPVAPTVTQSPTYAPTTSTDATTTSTPTSVSTGDEEDTDDTKDDEVNDGGEEEDEEDEEEEDGEVDEEEEDETVNDDSTSRNVDSSGWTTFEIAMVSVSLTLGSIAFIGAASYYLWSKYYRQPTRSEYGYSKERLGEHTPLVRSYRRTQR